MSRFFSLVFLGCFSAFGWAQTLEITAFPSSTLQERSQQQSHYRLVLSGLTRTQATTVPDHEVRLQGQLQRQVWSVPAEFSFNEVIDHFATQFAPLRTLYECRALDCGSNNFWANSIFGNARLVARDQFQYYRVALKEGEQQSTLYVLYVIQRGTRQIMVNVDVLTSPKRFNLELGSAAYLHQQLKSNSGWLAGFETEAGQFHPERSATLLRALQQLSAPNKAKLHLFVHCYSGDTLQQALECSEQLAQQLQAELGQSWHIQAQGATVVAPEGKKPALRFIYWPSR